jgi:hypothetical protein
MIDLNRSHSAFSMTLEILASIPPYPAYAAGKDLCDDFGFNTQREMKPFLARLEADYGLTASNLGKAEGHGRGLSIPRASWAAAYDAGLRYLERVNDGD